MEEVTPFVHLCKQLSKHALKLKQYSAEWVKGTADKMFMPWPHDGSLARAVLQHMTTYLHAAYKRKKLEKHLSSIELWKMYEHEKEEEPPLDWILHICKGEGEEPSVLPALSEMKDEIKKDEGLYPLRELKAATGYGYPSYESPTQSSDEGPVKDTKKDITSKVRRDKEKRNKKRSDRASISLDIRREIKRWKEDKDKTDEIALVQNEWLGGQTLLKLDGKSIEEVRQRGDQDKKGGTIEK